MQDFRVKDSGMTSNSVKPGDFICLEWSDPYALPGEWTKVRKKDMNVVGCTTVGIVHKVHHDRITVICSWDHQNKHANGGVTIPYVLISKYWKLRK
jgi:hypothetical protein